VSNKPLETVFIKKQTKAFLDLKLEETQYWINRYANHLVNTVEILEPLAFSEKVSSLLTEETLNRYRGVAYALSFPYKNYKREEAQENTKNLMALEQGFLVQSWSNLGSLLESTLQIFLSFYHHDYERSTFWNIWNENAVSQLKNTLNKEVTTALNNIIETNEKQGIDGITPEIRKSFLKKVRKVIKDKSVMPEINAITLYDLVHFYFEENVINKNEHSQDKYETISRYRNSIHSFQKREIGTWSELNEYSKLVLLLIIEILHRFPDIPDEITCEFNYFKEDRELFHQEVEWLDYQYLDA